MSASSLTPRPIEIHVEEVPHYIDFLEKFLGAEKITTRLQQIQRAIKIESGVYLHYWLLPNSTFWIGLQEARLRLPRVSPALEKTLEIAAKLKIFHNSMSPRLRSDFQSRILKADYLPPIFFEIDMAAHFWQLGYEVEWAEPSSEPEVRIPEFTLIGGGNKIEIECKSKRADAGRKISRPNFYKLVDEVATPLSTEGYTGKINIVVPDRMPPKDTWKKDVAKAIDQLLKLSKVQTKLDDGTEISIDIHKLNGLVVPAKKVAEEAQKQKHPYSYLAIFAKEYGKTLTNPLIFELKSQSDDHFLLDIFDNLRDANHQFTGNNQAMICCFVPEIDSFDGLQQESAIFNMTATFFKKHAKPNVFAVSYSSDSISIVSPTDISKSSPAIRFDNPYYDESFGARIRGFQ